MGKITQACVWEQNVILETFWILGHRASTMSLGYKFVFPLCSLLWCQMGWQYLPPRVVVKNKWENVCKALSRMWGHKCLYYCCVAIVVSALEYPQNEHCSLLSRFHFSWSLLGGPYHSPALFVFVSRKGIWRIRRPVLNLASQRTHYAGIIRCLILVKSKFGLKNIFWRLPISVSSM